MDRTFYEFVLTSNTLIESQNTKKFRVPLNQIHYYELFSTRKVAIRGGCNGPGFCVLFMHERVVARHECSILAFNITSHKAAHLSVRAFPLYI